ncbi:hypothetical protein A3J77_00125 [Candidatus Wolfebacteria bacterium RBG_13_41_7]|uniref:Uncharacterized protein n=1 Tax=Candidatus Wolfebacteria bacterium RBG_13_41_7 TaxID=1802554 RepID=A0A1F8DNP6_9BACT|nr:MAG: hypothetical protein A3J77_00125 [Candidatus Wolfebacteria bacterium RBG_13_41_7]
MDNLKVENLDNKKSMLKPVKFANAVTLVSVILQLAYTVKMAIVPNWIHYWMAAMMPGYNLASIETNSIGWGMSLLGVLVMAIIVWVATYAVIWLYNHWDK